jgi:hypothetical protein
MRKVDKTFVLPIYYSLYHHTNLTVNTLLYEIISFQNIIMSKKRTFTYTSDLASARQFCQLTSISRTQFVT